MRRRAGWIAFALIGCRIGFDEVPPDASVNAIDAMPDAAGCFGSQVKICFDVLPRGPVMLDADTDIDIDIDTERSPLCDRRDALYSTAGVTTPLRMRRITAAGSWS